MKFLSNLLEKFFGSKKSTEFENIVVGKILEINKHPNADRLRLAKVDIGNKELEVVCGAPNIEIGQKVPVALIGAKLPNGIILKEVEIRGIKSCGMLCAKDELGLGTDHSGIMILDEKAEIGMEFAKYINNR
jgi:phenylalanyl-tRNA synthetase beta chain